MEQQDSTGQQVPPNQVEYQPNIYPVMYWALAYGVIAGIILLVVWWLSSFITLLWAPVFLAGAAWGAYRNYKKQKDEWMRGQGVTPQKKSAMDEFRDAARDIVSASREMMAEQRAEDAAVQAEAAAAAEAESEVPIEESPAEEVIEQPTPLAPPVAPPSPPPSQSIDSGVPPSSLPPVPPPPNVPGGGQPQDPQSGL